MIERRKNSTHSTAPNGQPKKFCRVTQCTKTSELRIRWYKVNKKPQLHVTKIHSRYSGNSSFHFLIKEAIRSG